jgi:hypothetical protein
VDVTPPGAWSEKPARKGVLTKSSSFYAVLQLEINDVTRAWGLEVDRVELAVEAVLQPPQDSCAGPSLDSTLQQLALHLLGGGVSSVAGGALPPGPGE